MQKHPQYPFGANTELYFAIISGVFWFFGFVSSVTSSFPQIVITTAFIVSILFGGFFTLIESIKALRKGKFEIYFLMLIAAIGASFLGKWGEGALLLFLFSLGHALEHFALRRAKRSITALSDLAAHTALVKVNGELIEKNTADLAIGDIIVVKPNSKIAADGMILKGHSNVNEAPITGESIPVEKYPFEAPNQITQFKDLPTHNSTFSGTINGAGVLEIKVLRLTKDSTLSRLIKMVHEAESQKSPTQHLADKFEKYYVPTVLIVVAILPFAFLVLNETFSESFYRAMAVLIAASPCALAISTPSAVLAGIARAAKQGVLIKGGKPLEDLGNIKAIAFDKTGTLTSGKPQLTAAIPFGKATKEQLLKIAVAVESLSDHPLATAISNGGKKLLGKVEIPKATEIEAITARGIRAKWNDTVIHIGNRRLFEELTGKNIPEALDHQMITLEKQGQTAMIVHQSQQYIGIIAAMDLARPKIKETLANLKNVGIQKMIMLTGDNQKVANAVAQNIGITDPMGSLLPEDKVNAVNQLILENGKVAMVGDGVNDAPAMAKSTIGIAMGAAGSDVALETADVALMADKLDNLPFAIALSKKANRIIKQNLWISLGMVAILVPLTLLGIAEIGPAVIGHEGSTLVVVLNALRLLRFELE